METLTCSRCGVSPEDGELEEFCARDFIGGEVINALLCPSCKEPADPGEKELGESE